VLGRPSIVDPTGANSHRSNIGRNRNQCLHHLHSTPPLGDSCRNIAMTFGMEKLEWCVYPTVKNLTICLSVLTEFTNVIDGLTNGQTPHDGIDRACIASRGKNPRQGSGQLSGRPSGYKVAAYMAAWVFTFYIARTHCLAAFISLRCRCIM